MGATFYLEPVSTFDLDIFVVFEGQPRGHRAEGDAVVIGNWPVQFLPAETPLLREAVEQARQGGYEGTPPKGMAAGHLMAIAPPTGRAKDHARLLAFVESGVTDRARLNDILSRHSLEASWRRFEARYLDPQ